LPEASTKPNVVAVLDDLKVGSDPAWLVAAVVALGSTNGNDGSEWPNDGWAHTPGIAHASGVPRESRKAGRWLLPGTDVRSGPRA